MRRITQEELRGLYEAPDQALFDGVRDALSRLPEGKEQPIVRKKISVSIVLAAALVAMSMAALAAGGLRLFKQNGTAANPIVPLESAEELVVTDLGRSENDHAVLTVEEAVYDGQGVMALLRLTPKDAEHFAMYNFYCQDAPEDVYENVTMNARVGWGWFTSEDEYGTIVEVTNEPGFREVQVDDQVVPIPTDPEDAIAKGTIVYMDGDVMRVADREAPEPIARKDGRGLIDYDLTINNAHPENTLLDGTLGNASAEGQEDGGVLIWYNAYAERELSDELELSITGTTTLDGNPLPMPELRIQLKRAEQEKRYRLVPETDVFAGKVRLNEATINVSRLRSYVYLDYERLPEATLDDPVYLDLRTVDASPLLEGLGWMSSDDTHFLSQHETQPFETLPEVLVLELTDLNGNVLDRVTCKVVEEK